MYTIPLALFLFICAGNRITNDTMVGPTVAAINGTLLDLTFIGVRTSQAGQYTCEANVYTLRFGSMALTGQFALTVQRKLVHNVHGFC